MAIKRSLAITEPNLVAANRTVGMRWGYWVIQFESLSPGQRRPISANHFQVSPNPSIHKMWSKSAEVILNTKHTTHIDKNIDRQTLER